MVPVGIGRDNLKHLFAGSSPVPRTRKNLEASVASRFFIALRCHLPFIVPFINWEHLSWSLPYASLPSVNCNRNPSFSHCRFNLLGDANSMAQPAQIERCNKRMADSLINGHLSPRTCWSASCSPYCSLGMRWKESRTGCPAFLSKFIVIGGMTWADRPF